MPETYSQDDVAGWLRDAKRYRYLRSAPADVNIDHIDVVKWIADEHDSCNHGDSMRGEALDAEIDKRLK